MNRVSRYTFLLLVGLATFGPAQGSEVEPSAYDLIIDTNFTHIDVNGDGTPDLVRKFDRHGNVIESTFRDPWSNDGRTERTVYSSDRLKVETTWTVGTRVLEREESRFLPDLEYEGGRKLKEWIHTSDTSKVTNVYGPGNTVVVSNFERDAAGKWKLTAQESKSSLLNAQSAAQVHFGKDYPPCTGEVTDAWSCRDRFGTGVDTKQLSGTIANVPAACIKDKKSQWLKLETGFTVDLKSCKTVDAVTKIIAASGLARKMMSGCLAAANPRLALRAATTLREMWPRITCESPSDPKGVGDGATTMGETPNGGDPIALTGASPLTDPNVDTRRIGITIFHEFHHSCGINSPNPPHNHIGNPGMAGRTDPVLMAKLKDPVYGCQYLCGEGPVDSRMFNTKELCESCLGDGYHIDPADKLYSASDAADFAKRSRSKCGGFLAAADLAAANTWQWHLAWKKMCPKGAKTDKNCAEKSPAFKRLPECSPDGVVTEACESAMKKQAEELFTRIEKQYNGTPSPQLEWALCESGKLLGNGWYTAHGDICKDRP